MSEKKGVNAAAKEFVPSWLRDKPATPEAQPVASAASQSPSKSLNVTASEWRPGLGAQPYTPSPEVQQHQQHQQPQQQYQQQQYQQQRPPSGPQPGAVDGENLMFYDSGRMIRPQDQPHFFNPNAAPPLPTVQVGRVGSMPSAHQRAGIMPMTAPFNSRGPSQSHDPSMSPQHSQQQSPQYHANDVSGERMATPPPQQQTGVATLAMDPNSPGVMPATTEEASIFTTLSRLPRPLIVLVVGGRGSGKSTQSRAIAIKYGLLHLCSGDIVRNEGHPLAVLEDVLKYVEAELTAERARRKAAREAKEVGGDAHGATPADSTPETQSATSTPPPQKHKYASARRGIVLDRYLNNAEADPLFLLELLHRYGLQLDLVVNLMMSYEAAVARAEERDAEAAAADSDKKDKPKKDQRRLLEHLTVFNSCTHVFQPYGGLSCLDVEGLSIEEVEHQINLRVDRTIIGIRAGAAGARRQMLPPPQLCPGVSMHLVYNDYLEARKDLHDVLGTPASKYGLSPASLMTGLVHGETMKRLRWYLKDYHVSWKADGTRIIIARHLKFGFIAFTGKFTSFYVIDPKLVPSHWHDLPTGFEGMEAADDDEDGEKKPTALGDRKLTNVTHIFDAELVENHQGKWKLYLFDVLYAVSTAARAGTPLLGSKTLWKERYAFLQALCSGLNDANAWTFMCLKKFVPCGDIRGLVNAVPSFPTDGIVFQHPDPYRVPTDNRLYKWKPRDQCSADFRLGNGVELPERKVWLFFPLVLRLVNGVADESGFKNAIVEIPTTVVEKNDLSDGAVVECLKTERSLEHEGFGYEVWEYLRPRPDKVYPNYDHIAKQIDEMEHLSQPDVVDLCEQYCGTAPEPKDEGRHQQRGRGGGGGDDRERRATGERPDRSSGATAGKAAGERSAPTRRAAGSPESAAAPASASEPAAAKPQAWRPKSSATDASSSPPAAAAAGTGSGNAWARGDLRSVMGSANADEEAAPRTNRWEGSNRGGYDGARGGDRGRGGRGSGDRGSSRGGRGGDRGGRGGDRGGSRGRGGRGRD